jgi:hypothetical protein
MRKEAKAIAAAKGQEMLDVLAGWAHDVTLPWEKRMRAIEIALPYCRPKLQATMVDANVNNNITFVISDTDSQL